MQQTGLALFAKRVFDRTAAAIGLVAAAPLIGATALAVRVALGSPVLFRQRRPGLHGRPFELWKFRTMLDARRPDGTLLPDAERLTPFGRFLRSTSLDELPQLVNVLRGELSLVGPRPLLVEYLTRYSSEQGRRHDVLPGITGWCQVNGRNALDWDDKLALDVWYVDHWSLALDLRILARTALAVFARKDIARDGHVTMPVFEGPRAYN
jgi:lipopolysaccharide/colanic/teichoic acid biosynthesis glycosyltransferase